MVDRNLIFDIGANHGEDSEFYLSKGFKVIAIEASPYIADELRHKFSQYIISGHLILINKGIMDKPNQITFYRNLDNDHWSSFDVNYGTRNNTRFETFAVQCTTIGHLIKEYGTPYYMKIDVEGADKLVLSQMTKEGTRPEFISVEEYGFSSIKDLHSLGYDLFCITAQGNKGWVNLPFPSLEGKYVERKFSGRDSGPFGRDIARPWLSLEQVTRDFLEKIRDVNGSYIGPAGEWFDIHATSRSTLNA